MNQKDTLRLSAHKIPTAGTGIEIRKTICAICEGGSGSCGVNAYVRGGRVIKVEGMPEFPQDRGTLCAKGCAARQYIYNSERILSPMRRSGAHFEPIAWEAALDLIAERLLAIKPTGALGFEVARFSDPATRPPRSLPSRKRRLGCVRCR